MKRINRFIAIFFTLPLLTGCAELYLKINPASGYVMKAVLEGKYFQKRDPISITHDILQPINDVSIVSQKRTRLNFTFDEHMRLTIGAWITEAGALFHPAIPLEAMKNSFKLDEELITALNTLRETPKEESGPVWQKYLSTYSTPLKLRVDFSLEHNSISAANIEIGRMKYPFKRLAEDGDVWELDLLEIFENPEIQAFMEKAVEIPDLATIFSESKGMRTLVAAIKPIQRAIPSVYLNLEY